LSGGDPVSLNNFFFAVSIASGVAFVGLIVVTVLGLEGVELRTEDAATSFKRAEAGRVELSLGSRGRDDGDWEALGSDTDAI
jgi:hypothetical protein